MAPPRSDDTERRRRLLYAALGFCRVAGLSAFPEASALKTWLSTWSGIGHIVTGMARQGYSVSLRKVPDDGWSATFQRQTMLAPEGFANASTPFDAVLGAAWSALNTRPLHAPRGDTADAPL